MHSDKLLDPETEGIIYFLGVGRETQDKERHLSIHLIN